MSRVSASFGALPRNSNHSLSLYTASVMKNTAGIVVHTISRKLLPWLYTALTPLAFAVLDDEINVHSLRRNEREESHPEDDHQQGSRSDVRSSTPPVTSTTNCVRGAGRRARRWHPIETDRRTRAGRQANGGKNERKICEVMAGEQPGQDTCRGAKKNMAKFGVNAISVKGLGAAERGGF